MNHEGDLTPSQPEPAPGSVPQARLTPSLSWFARYKLAAFSAAGVVAVGALAVAAALVLNKPGSTIEKMVPATHDVLVIANLNPSLSQKANLLRAVHSFPDTRTDSAISAKLDEAFKDAGLSYTNDVQPWLGGEIGVSGKANFESGADSPFALYAVSRDDARAQAAMAKLRTGSAGKKYSWTDETYNGIRIAVGMPVATSEKPVAYSFVDHVVVAASSAAMIHEIIDTDQGRGARLVDSADFKATMKLLPSDRVGMGYIAGTSLVTGVKKQMAKPSALGVPALKTLDDLNALQGIGGAVSATGTGVAFDVAIKLDENKLSPATRQAFKTTGHPDAVLRWIPKNSDGFLAIANLDQSIKTLLDQYGSDPSVKAGADAIGLTGPAGILPHLTGALGVEVELGNNSIPSGAMLIGTNDTAAINAFFGKLLVLASATAGPQQPGAGITRATYRGTVITTWRGSSLGAVPGLAPSYAALDGMGIVASSPAEVKAVIDAHAGGSNVTANPSYQAASAASLTQPAGILFVNIERVVSLLEKLPTGSSMDARSVADLAPLKAFMLTATSQAGAAVERVFVTIK